MRAIIVAYVDDPYNTSNPQYQIIQQAVTSNDLIICADGGANAAAVWNIVPKLLIGDMDSIDHTVLQRFSQNPQIKVETLPVEKDQTDLELAVMAALEAGATDIEILSSLGGRFDHALGSTYLLSWSPLLAKGITARIVGSREELKVLTPEKSPTVVSGKPGELISLISIKDDAEGVTTEGLHYPLRDETLSFGTSRGLSNLFLSHQASISLTGGMLLIIHNLAESQ